MQKVFFNWELDLDDPINMQIYKILKPLSPKERRDFLYSAILFYNHAPEFYHLKTFEAALDNEYSRFEKLFSKFQKELKELNFSEIVKHNSEEVPSTPSMTQQTTIQQLSPSPASPEAGALAGNKELVDLLQKFRI